MDLNLVELVLWYLIFTSIIISVLLGLLEAKKYTNSGIGLTEPVSDQ